MNTKTVIIIAGPTAVGKTNLSISLAQYFNAKIISSDSRQCYKELNIGVAKPSQQQLESVQHYFINSHSVNQPVNASLFEKYALNTSYDLFKINDIVIMTGGTGLYIKAFCDGLDDIPQIDKVIQNEINLQYQQKGILWIQNQLKEIDNDFYLKGEIMNPHRSIRALTVKLSTGRSILSFHTKANKIRDFNIIKLGLELPIEKLTENINYRTDLMIQNGLPAEVKSLLEFRHLQALQTVGYKELFNHFDGKETLENAISEIKTNTRKYAKRQMTWFKKDKEIMWFNAEDPIDQIQNYIKGIL